jgi:tRNA pseudouridine38-40 synthase
VDRGVVRLRLSYDGRAFYGSQRQSGRRTIQGELERAAAEVTGRTVKVYLAGRTDRGVHAACQVATFSREGIRISLARLPVALNDHLEDDLAVLEASAEPRGFHARYSAVWREYRYRIWCGGRQPLAAGFVTRIPRQLDFEVANDAATRLIGEHDFAAFASGGEGVPWSSGQKTPGGTVRNVWACKVVKKDNWWGAPKNDGVLIEIRIVADGYLPKMVRGIVGTLVEIGKKSRPIGLIDELLTSKDRRLAPKNAPPEGLVLWAVGYSDDLPTME